MRPAYYSAIIALLAGLASSASAQLPTNVKVELELFEVEHADLARVFGTPRETTDASLLRVIVERGKNDFKKGKLVGHTAVKSVLGERSSVEGGKQYVYPTEFDPAEIPQNIQGPITKENKIITPSNPIAFNMRPLGLRLEAQTQRTARGDLQVSVDFTHTALKGQLPWGKGAAAVKMPLFYSVDGTASFNLPGHGGIFFIGTFTPAPEKAGDLPHLHTKRLMAFATVSLLDPRGQPVKADKEPKLVRPNIGVLTEYIELPLKEWGAIMTEKDRRKKLQPLLEAGTARLLETSYISSAFKQRAKARSAFE